MQHSQPHITLYGAIFFNNWDGNSECNVESLIIILSSSSLVSLRLSSYVSLTRLLCSSLIATCSNNFGTSWGSVWISNITLIQSLEIGDWTTWGWHVIHAYRLRLICSLPNLMALRLKFAASIQRFAFFLFMI